MSQDYQETDFFEFDNEDEQPSSRENNKFRLAAIGTMLAAVIFAILLSLFGIRSMNEANANEGYEGRTWVMSGSYVDLTPDLQTKSNVAIYQGALPADQRLVGADYRSDLQDVQQIKSVGETVKFRGSQTGDVREDFPEKVDALLVEKDNGELQVVRTGDEGSLKEVTSSTVTTQRILGWVMMAGALLVLVGGVAGTIYFFRKES